MLATFFTGHPCVPKQGWGFCGSGAQNARQFVYGFFRVLENNSLSCLGAENARVFICASIFVEVGGLPLCGPNKIKLKNFVVRAHNTPANLFTALFWVYS